ncbi:12800_t:CDS:2 [Gigaspora margarita]|uniref:12800_t:CDS:1 n=1 Tax=Gigaspora margarita TaxID=4874 RepID=A0ABN7V3W8_GIGMA|nr:12800_t:CDS:2 [Gigaspora margarita]
MQFEKATPKVIAKLAIATKVKVKEMPGLQNSNTKRVISKGQL